ncbi:hypothetical protein QWY99_18620 [Flavobacterium branchiarum]|uniref:Uncharacterized protein n=1 Tax=Flavobacterium branchiarum TaxID=1114870 RepID=A0ABV5FIU6_9FLAO|nr:hypothetical protein [Flavobacterium branchiarum]MDN3675052.1 hypothetical protein [Flavobacterium branchiarum]
MYLYKTSENNYEALIFEIFPDKNSKNSSQSIDGGDFNGYISSWDLKNGFIKAAQFENNKIVQEGLIAMLSSANNNEQSKMIADPCYYCPDEEEPTGGSGGFPGTPLRDVVITSPSSPPSFPPMTYIPRGPSYGGVTNPSEYTNPPRGGGGSSGGGVTAPVQIIDALTEKAKCLNALLNKNGNSFVQKILSNFVGKSEFDIKIVSKDKVFSDETKTKELNGRTLPPINKTITIEISIAKTNENSALDAARTILHEYIHADIFRKLNTTTGTNQEKLDFKTTYEAYGNQHNTIASMYLNSMREALKEFHKNVLTDDYNKYINYYGEVPSDAFYEALAWGGLRDNNVKAWTDLSADKKAAIEKLASRVPLLSKLVPCPQQNN